MKPEGCSYRKHWSRHTPIQPAKRATKAMLVLLSLTKPSSAQWMDEHKSKTPGSRSGSLLCEGGKELLPLILNHTRLIWFPQFKLVLNEDQHPKTKTKIPRIFFVSASTQAWNTDVFQTWQSTACGEESSLAQQESVNNTKTNHQRTKRNCHHMRKLEGGCTAVWT